MLQTCRVGPRDPRPYMPKAPRLACRMGLLLIRDCLARSNWVISLRVLSAFPAGSVRQPLQGRRWIAQYGQVEAIAVECDELRDALLLHRGLARNHGELRRRALERLPGLRATVQVGGHYLVDQRPRRVVRRDHPMQ
jgi:hypothetical protein